MTWTYEQRTGRLLHDGTPVATGYAGHGAGYNNPVEQGTKNIGPIPQGAWTIGAMRAAGGRMGPDVLPLEPAPGTDPLGRDAFFIHGDLVDGPPRSASDGCTIMPHDVRERIVNSGDTDLQVVTG
jgi:hypothetical protein